MGSLHFTDLNVRCRQLRVSCGKFTDLNVRCRQLRVSCGKFTDLNVRCRQLRGQVFHFWRSVCRGRLELM